MVGKLLITGATGNVGAEVVKLLIKNRHSVRAAGTNMAAITKQFGAAVEAVVLDFGKPETFAPAFAGVERMFLMRPPAISNVKQTIIPAIDAAQQAGVQQIVFLSLIGAEQNRFVPHYPIEQHLLTTGLDYTFLRASFFMQNLNTTQRREIQEEQELWVPAGKGKTSFIDVRDIAAVAVLALTENGHTNQAYALTGSEALDYSAVAKLFSAILGRTITYRNPSLLRFVWRQRSRGVPWTFIAVMAGIYTTVRLGWAGRISPETGSLLGRTPITLRQYIEDYSACWSPPASIPKLPTMSATNKLLATDK